MDQAIQLYQIDKGSLPSSLDDLRPDYLSGKDKITDAKNQDIDYKANTSTYTLTGQDASGKTITSNGSTTTETDTSISDS